MAEFQVRSDAVDVEQIMRQIRARIREKRGADYTEQEIRELASVKLEKFLLSAHPLISTHVSRGVATGRAYVWMTVD